MIAPVATKSRTSDLVDPRAAWHVISSGKLISSLIRELLGCTRPIEEANNPDGRALHQFANAGLVIASTDLPNGEATSLLSRLKCQYPTIPRLKFLMSPEELCPTMVARGDVNGFVSMHDDWSEFRRVAESVSAGRFTISQSLRARFEQCRNGDVPDESKLVVSLTERQYSVFLLLSGGMSVKEVARSIGRSAKAVDSHKFRLMRKLGIHDRLDLCRLAIRLSLLPA